MIPDVTVKTETLDLGWYGTELNVLMVHPQIDCEREQAGFMHNEASAKRSLVMLDSVLQCANDDHTQLVLFPEYSLPTKLLDSCIEIVAEKLPESCLCIACFDSMPLEDWNRLREGAINGEALSKISGAGLEWVNTAVIWFREEAKQPLKYYLQPKLEPAKPEKDSGMLRGHEILHLTVNQWKLAQVICFDFMADRNNRPVLEPFLQGLTDTDLFIVLQANEHPDDHRFMEGVERLVSSQYSKIGAVAFVNIAQESEDSGIFFRPDLWIPEKEKASLPDAPAVWSSQYVTNKNAIYVAFRQHGAAAHRFIYQSPLKYTGGDLKDQRFVRDALVANFNNGALSTLRSLRAVDYYLERILPGAAPKRYGLNYSSEKVEELVQSAYDGLGTIIPAGLKPGRKEEILRVLLGDIGTAADWHSDTRSRWNAVERLIVALAALAAGGIVLDLELKARNTAEGKWLKNHPLTAQSDKFTLDVVAGIGRGIKFEIKNYLSNYHRENWLHSIKQPHVCLFLNSPGLGTGLSRVTEDAFLLKPPRSATYAGDRAEFGAQVFEQDLTSQTRYGLYIYGFDRLCALLTAATSDEQLKQLIEEVFMWTAA